MPARKKGVPSYCLHKPSGKAYCRIYGKVVYLGNYNSPESKNRYAILIAALVTQPAASIKPLAAGGVTVVEVIAAYLEFAEGYYRKDGKPSGNMPGLLASMRVLREMYGSTEAIHFGPLALRAIQKVLVDRDAARKYINKQCGYIKGMFKWAVSMEILPATVHQALSTVPGLKRGRTEARETKPILPVDDTLVDATLPYMPAVVADMVRVQRLIGCRPTELCILRPCDIEHTGDVWIYRPESHKTEHHGRDRLIFIGPQAQGILKPYLLRTPDDYCFSPAESVAKWQAEKRTQRKTPVQPSQKDRRKKKPQRIPGKCYDKNSYRLAIVRAVEKANKARAEEAADMGIEPILLPHWHPNQLRHSAATRIRRQFGLEAAQVILGHAKADVTQVYAERDAALAIEVSRQIG